MAVSRKSLVRKAFRGVGFNLFPVLVKGHLMAKDSEFGGHAGRIQPLPHQLTNVEQARLERHTEPTDPTATADSQRVVDAGKRGIGPVQSPSGNL